MSLPSDELREIWTSGSGQEGTDVTDLLGQVKKRSSDFDRVMVRCTWAVYPISGLLALGDLWIAFRTANPVVRVARFLLAAFFVWTIVFLYRYIKASQKPAPEETLTAYRQALVEKYERQLRLLKNLKYWYTIPPWLGLITSAVYLKHRAAAGTFIVAAIILAAINALTFWLNDVRGVRSLRRQREALIAQAAESGAAALKIISVLLLAGAMHGGVRAGTRTAEIDRIVQPVIASGTVMGAVIGVREGDAAEFHGYGKLAANGPDKPNQSTVFEIGSVTKVFTSLALARMAHSGLVALDDPVRKYLPAGTIPEPGQNDAEIRLVDLATHTSGLPRMPDNFKPANPSNPYADYSIGRLYAFLSKQRLLREPGAAYLYSNVGAGLLGHVLARRAELSYEQLIITTICKPLSLGDTGITVPGELRSRLAQGHDADGEPVPAIDMGALAGAGALRSTAADMMRFLAANLYPPDPMRTAIGDSQVVLAKIKRPAGSITLGWHVQPDGKTCWHNGATPGFGAYVSFDMQHKRVVVVLINTTGLTQIADQIGVRLEKLMAAEAIFPIQLRTAIQMDPKMLDAYAGKYEMAGTPFTIRREGDYLKAEQAGQPAVRLYPESETKFFMRALNAQVTFQKNASGEVTELIFDYNGSTRTGRRMP